MCRSAAISTGPVTVPLKFQATGWPVKWPVKFREPSTGWFWFSGLVFRYFTGKTGFYRIRLLVREFTGTVSGGDSRRQTVESPVFWHPRLFDTCPTSGARSSVLMLPHAFVVVFYWVGFLCGCVFADLASASSLQKLILLRKMDLLNVITPEMRTDFIALLWNLAF